MAGHFSPRLDTGFSSQSRVTGSFSVGEKFANKMVLDTSSDGHYINFDPSLVASEYVNNGSLQPSALQTFVCIRI